MNKKIFYLLTFISLGGFLVSAYLGYISYLQKGICSLNGCNFVLNSQYAKFLGIPNAFWGSGYFFLILVLNLILSKGIKKNIFYATFILSFLAFIFSVYLIYTQVAILKSICYYCLTVDFSAILIFLILFYNLIKANKTTKVE